MILVRSKGLHSLLFWYMPEAKSEIRFLKGPQSRWEEFKFTVKVMMEFVRGFRGTENA